MSAAVPVSEMGMVITMQESSPAPRGSLPELCTFGAIALADMIRRRKVSAEEVMATYLDHIGRTNPAGRFSRCSIVSTSYCCPPRRYFPSR